MDPRTLPFDRLLNLLHHWIVSQLQRSMQVEPLRYFLGLYDDPAVAVPAGPAEDADQDQDQDDLDGAPSWWHGDEEATAMSITAGAQLQAMGARRVG